MTKHFLVALVVCVFAATASAQLCTITQSVDNVTVTMGNSVACQNAGGTVDNGYWRDYSPTTQGIFFPIFLHGVDIGIESLTSTNGGAGSMPITVEYFSDPTPGDIAVMIADHVLLAAETFNVPDQALTIAPLRFTCPAAAYVPTGADNLVVRVFSPSVGEFFFIGSNASGETATSYLEATGCGAPLPTPVAGIGFPTMNMIIDVVFDKSVPVGGAGLFGTCEDLTLFSGANGVTDEAGAKTLDATNTDTLTFTIATGSAFAANNYIGLASFGPPTSYVDVAGGLGPIYLPINGNPLGDISGGSVAAPPLNVQPVLGAGVTINIVLLPSFAGMEIGLQGLALGANANNAIYASTYHHTLSLI